LILYISSYDIIDKLILPSPADSYITMKRKFCIVTLVLLGTSCLAFAQYIGSNILIAPGNATSQGNLEVKGASTYDAPTKVYITNNATDFGRTNLILTGRLQDRNDIGSLVQKRVMLSFLLRMKV
jgi:hypothetical protein